MSNFEHKQRAHNIFSKIIIIILYYNNSLCFEYRKPRYKTHVDRIYS